MAREAFLKQIARAAHAMRLDKQRNGAIRFEAIADWLGADFSRAFDPREFAELSPESNQGLSGEVERLKEAAAQQPTNQAAISAHVDQIAAILGPIVREEWLAATETLIGQCEAWALKLDWATRRIPKKIDEAFLGEYETHQLLVHLLSGRVIIDPITRFVGGGEGLVDIYAFPSMASRSLVRRERQWKLLPTTGTGKPREWNEVLFKQSVEALIQDRA